MSHAGIIATGELKQEMQHEVEVDELKPGYYDLPLTRRLKLLLDNLPASYLSAFAGLDEADAPNLLSHPLSRELAKLLWTQLEQANDPLEAIQAAFSIDGPLDELLKQNVVVEKKKLTRIYGKTPESIETKAFPIALSVSDLLSGSSRSPSLRSMLSVELETCDRADWLVSFIRFSGIKPLMEVLKAFTATPAEDGGPRLRVATTAYMGVTERRALELLMELPNTEVRVSLDTLRTRLHAKAYIFHRATGFGSAYVGSANLSHAATNEGLEWTTKIAQYDNPVLWQRSALTFEAHWMDTQAFEELRNESLERVMSVLARELRRDGDNGDIATLSLEPLDFQVEIQAAIDAERAVGKNKHLIVAATGTGKTMVAAFDYRALARRRRGPPPTLLFLAHREELVKQARAKFRQVLDDGSFGTLVFGGSDEGPGSHTFCTVQSWHSRDFNRMPGDHFEYVVLDEAHHGSAESYQSILEHVKPRTLLGLTATPERMDGKNIRDDFGGGYTHEIRLPQAIDHGLLCPFHYYGVSDAPGIDFSQIEWSRGRYSVSQLEELVLANEDHARWTLSQLSQHVTDVRDIRALGFCVSIAHAQFMADYANRSGITALAITSDSGDDERRSAKQRLQQRDVNIIFSVDLYNEGVDMPFLDTVMFLRPTESLTVFLQQLGRGLRKNHDKPHLTVLDFIAPQRREFNIAARLRALTSRGDISIAQQVEEGFPFVPSGCVISLEKQAREHILQNIREYTRRLNRQGIAREIQRMRERLDRIPSLREILQELGIDDPDWLYSKGLPSVLARGDQVEESPVESAAREGGRRILLLDDRNAFTAALEGLQGRSTSNELLELVCLDLCASKDISVNSVDEFKSMLSANPGIKQDLTDLLQWLVEFGAPHQGPSLPNVAGPLRVHHWYSRRQVLFGLGVGGLSGQVESREGKLHVPDRKVDAFFVEVQKSESEYSPTTLYDDFAITDRIFHWQTQSTTSDSSPTFQRYRNHAKQGYTPLLFIRHRRKRENGLTSPYFFAGPVKYRSHRGSRPVSIEWELEFPLPPRVLEWARRTA